MSTPSFTTIILVTRPERLTESHLNYLHQNPVLRDRYNQRWGTAWH